jgi:hypothetical protein
MGGTAQQYGVSGTLILSPSPFPINPFQINPFQSLRRTLRPMTTTVTPAYRKPEHFEGVKNTDRSIRTVCATTHCGQKAAVSPSHTGRIYVSNLFLSQFFNALQSGRRPYTK